MSLVRLLAGLLLASSVSVRASVPLSQGDAYDKLVSEGRGLLVSSPGDAFMKGVSALAIKADGWEAAWLCGDAQTAQGLTDSAREFYNQAKKNAPPEKVAEIQKSLDGSLAASPSTLGQDAEDALSQGFKAKAARLFAVAFRKLPNRPDFGLKAVTLLEELAPNGFLISDELAHLCVEVFTQYPKSPEAAKCRDTYNRYVAAFQLRSYRYVAMAGYAHWQGNTAQCLEFLDRASICYASEDLKDSRLNLRTLSALVLLDDKRTDDALSILRQALKLGHGFNLDAFGSKSLLWLVRRDRIAVLLKDPKVSAFFGDVVGPEGLASMTASLKQVAEHIDPDHASATVVDLPGLPGGAEPAMSGFDARRTIEEAIKADNPTLVKWVQNFDPYAYSETELLATAVGANAKSVLASVLPLETTGQRRQAYDKLVYLAETSDQKASSIWATAVAFLRPEDVEGLYGRSYLKGALQGYRERKLASGVIERLISLGVDPNSPVSGTNPKSVMILYATTERSKFLLDLALHHGADPLRGIGPKDRATTVFHTFADRNDEFVEELFKSVFQYKKYRWGLNVRDNDGKTAMDLLRYRNRDLADELKKWLKDNPGID